MTQKYPGKSGTYTLEIEAPYYHILNGKAGYKLRILALNYDPDDESNKNPFFANMDELQGIMPPMAEEEEMSSHLPAAPGGASEANAAVVAMARTCGRASGAHKKACPTRQ